MINLKNILSLVLLCSFLGACTGQDSTSTKTYAVNKTTAEWKKELTAEQYHVLREKGTERPDSGEYYHHDEKGTYTCAACNFDLFKSNHKYDSGSGWPAFDRPINKTNVEEHTDTAYGMSRTEVLCSNCGGHLGHVFNDGPRATTGQRYCINSVSLNFKKTKE